MVNTRIFGNSGLGMEDVDKHALQYFLCHEDVMIEFTFVELYLSAL